MGEMVDGDRISILARRAGGRMRSLLRAVRRLLVVGAQPWESLRDLLNPNLQRAFRSYWARRSRLLGAAALLVTTAGVAAVITSWAVLAVVLAPFAGQALVLAWRRRPGWGRARGWPPGRVGVGTGPMMRFDGFAAPARRFGPVFKSNYFGDPLVCVADLGRATRLLRDHADDLGHRPLLYNRYVPGGAIRWAPEPRHTELRRRFARALSPRLVAEWEPAFADLVRDRLEAIATEVAAPRDFLRDAAREVCTAFLLGVGPEHDAFSEVRACMDRLDICRAYPVSAEEAEAHLQWFTDLLRAEVAASERPGRPPSVAAVLERQEPGALADPGVLRNLVYLALGPRDDVAGLMVWVCWYLVHNPRWLDEVRGAPDGDVARRVVSETLRLDQSEYVMRRVLRDIPFDDMVIPEDWLVRVCIREIHRDPANHPDPTRFDPDRFLEPGPDRSTFAPFGIDHHSCIGEALARAIAEVFVRELACGYDVALVSDGPRGLSVNGHWAPNGDFAVRLQPRAGAPGASPGG